MQGDFGIGNITVSVKFNMSKLFEEIHKIEENEKIYDVFIRDTNELCLSTETDFYVIDLSEYLECN